MIGPLPDDFELITCTSKGIYRAWPDLFPLTCKNEKYKHAIHTVFLHPISIMVNRYGMPDSISVDDKSDPNNDDDVTFELFLNYGEDVKAIGFNSLSSSFSIDVEEPMKQHKNGTYYKMLKYYVESDFKPTINNGNVGKNVLAVIENILELV